MKVKTKKRTVYVSEDGAEWDTEQEAILRNDIDAVEKIWSEWIEALSAVSEDDDEDGDYYADTTEDILRSLNRPTLLQRFISENREKVLYVASGFDPAYKPKGW